MLRDQPHIDVDESPACGGVVPGLGGVPARRLLLLPRLRALRQEGRRIQEALPLELAGHDAVGPDDTDVCALAVCTVGDVVAVRF